VQFNITELASFLAPALEEKSDKGNNESPRDKSNGTVADASKDPSTELRAPNETALTLALCGWTGSAVDGLNLAYCEHCFARAGLWLYHSTDDHGMKFDPVTFHRSHCPWQNPESQAAVNSFAGLAAWQILVALTYNKMHRELRHRDSLIQLTRPEDLLSVVSTDDTTGTESRYSRDDMEREDKARESKLTRLKRAFTVKRLSKIEPESN
jgi:hypothetical protein